MRKSSTAWVESSLFTHHHAIRAARADSFCKVVIQIIAGPCDRSNHVAADRSQGTLLSGQQRTKAPEHAEEQATMRAAHLQADP